jgi:uncharacterized protein (DUF362 family)
MIDRRDFLKAAGGAVVAASLPGCQQDDRWQPAAFVKQPRSQVAIVPAASYEHPLEQTILTGLKLFRLDVNDRKVVLKPNFVEFDPRGVINTHPAVLAATIEAFRRLGAREVVVAEGPGHRRDNEYLLSASGIGDALSDTGTTFVDLNHDTVDLFVSLPKMKTHHWAGVTLSMKNLFGIVPGSVYGWPKNLLHWAGIGDSILDINASIGVPRFNIVDGIVGMQGNGPIQGDPIRSGVMVFGGDPVAVDATCSRLMNIDPSKIGYLKQADAFLGNLGYDVIEQIGESVDRFQQDYQVLEHFQRAKATQRMTSG